MEIKKIKNDDIEIIGEVETTEAKIDNSSLPFLFEMVSKSLYSNPIQSIIREITSNCFDSHKEAEVEDAVIIRKSYDIDAQQYYISFIDVGVGMSPRRITKTYMKYFSSTKRDTNEEIGGFGLN
ncbi:MAG: hypothetical protein JST04_00820 [Bdellovibrionales bacterium]|nr:hypothetical protein [Bdellovibrionales bacterium]